MKLRDRFDILHLLVLLLALAGTVVLAFGSIGSDPSGANAELDRQMEQDIAYRARVDFLKSVYAPVEELAAVGKHQQALLKLEEIGRRYPGEGYGFILKGEILGQLGAGQEAIASYVKAVRLNGDFVDRQSPLSAFREIEQLVENGLLEFKPKAAAHPDNPSLKQAVTDLYYLQSRLAGGCE